jgi:hypothetical protein
LRFIDAPVLIPSTSSMTSSGRPRVQPVPSTTDTSPSSAGESPPPGGHASRQHLHSSWEHLHSSLDEMGPARGDQTSSPHELTPCQLAQEALVRRATTLVSTPLSTTVCTMLKPVIHRAVPKPLWTRTGTDLPEISLTRPGPAPIHILDVSPGPATLASIHRSSRGAVRNSQLFFTMWPTVCTTFLGAREDRRLRTRRRTFHEEQRSHVTALLAPRGAPDEAYAFGYMVYTCRSLLSAARIGTPCSPSTVSRGTIDDPVATTRHGDVLLSTFHRNPDRTSPTASVAGQPGLGAGDSSRGAHAAPLSSGTDVAPLRSLGRLSPSVVSRGTCPEHGNHIPGFNVDVRPAPLHARCLAPTRSRQSRLRRAVEPMSCST